MNKQELINVVSTKVDLTKTKTSEVIDAVVEAISASLISGEKVTLVGFGTFQTAGRKERKGRNPKNGAEILIPAKRIAKWKPGSSLQSSVNNEITNA
jgi:DNA-binding protein HU-beta